jgi:hypothetical protein
MPHVQNESNRRKFGAQRRLLVFAALKSLWSLPAAYPLSLAPVIFGRLFVVRN